MMIEQLLGHDVTLFFWNDHTQREFHGRLLLGLAGYYSVEAGHILIHFHPANVDNIDSSGHIWLKKEVD